MAQKARFLTSIEVRLVIPYQPPAGTPLFVQVSPMFVPSLSW